METTEYQRYDALGLADLVRRGETTPAELMQCAIALAQQRGPALNAICYERYEESLALARDWTPRQVFQGIPFLLKDSSLASRRFPASVGSRLFKDIRFDYDGTLTQRFDAAGLIPFARTTVPEFCMAPTTEAVINNGPARNPWDLGRSTGGSSGGAAAAIAARIVPMAHGSDGGGSIRIPAACCGLFGLKPSRGIVPVGPAKGEIWGGLGTDGVLSISVRDTAAALDAVGGREPGAPYAAPAGTGGFLDAAQRASCRPLRIAMWTSAWDGIEIAPENEAATVATGRLLESLGHHVEAAAPMSWDYAAFVRAHQDILAANIVASTHARLASLGRPLQDDDLEHAIRDGYEIGRSLTAEAYLSAINRLHESGRVIEAYLQKYDLILTPSLTTLPVELGYLSMKNGFRELRGKVARYAAFMAVVNASGTSAVNLPLHTTESGLPVGTQLIGKLGDDALLLSVSAQLEQSSPWAQRMPPICSASAPH